jgi:hypothetical protein
MKNSVKEEQNLEKSQNEETHRHKNTYQWEEISMIQNTCENEDLLKSQFQGKQQ